jgi:elongation factor Ts
MAEISAALVKELRDQTGAPMMDTKRALQDANGDVEAAKRLLRERGMASAEKRAGRTTSEGVVLLKTGDRRGSLVAIGCETEPVSKNEEFHAFAERVLDAAYSAELAENAGELEEERKELIGKIGENIAIVGTATFEAVDGARIEGYVHPPANKLGVLVQLRGGSPEVARKVAMHIAAMSPRWVERESIPDEDVEAERQIFLATDEVQSKPEQAREKIVDGMLNKRFFGANVLLEQEWIHDSSKKVGDALADEGAEVLEFERFELSA